MALRLPVLASKTWTKVSSLPDAISVPSGDHATALTGARCPVKIIAFLLLTVVCVAGGGSLGVMTGTVGGASFLESAYHPAAPPSAATATRPTAKTRRETLLASPRRGASSLCGKGFAGGGGTGTKLCGWADVCDACMVPGTARWSWGALNAAGAGLGAAIGFCAGSG